MAAKQLWLENMKGDQEIGNFILHNFKTTYILDPDQKYYALYKYTPGDSKSLQTFQVYSMDDNWYGKYLQLFDRLHSTAYKRSENDLRMIGLVISHDDEILTDAKGHRFLFSPVRSSATLESLLEEKYLTERDVQHFSRQILDIIVFLHSRNMFLTNADLDAFSLINYANDKTLCIAHTCYVFVAEHDLSNCVIPQYPSKYLAPEIIANDLKIGPDTFRAANMYTLGVMMYVLATKRCPFGYSYDYNLIDKIVLDKYIVPTGLQFSLDFHLIVQALMDSDPNCRPSPASLPGCFWFQKGVIDLIHAHSMPGYRPPYYNQRMLL